MFQLSQTNWDVARTSTCSLVCMIVRHRDVCSNHSCCTYLGSGLCKCV